MLSPTDPANPVSHNQMVVRADLACILEHALNQRARTGESLPQLLGLDPGALGQLAARWFPGAALPDLDLPPQPLPEDQKAIALLLLWRGGDASEESRWLACIVARRALENSHLWEDLGLPSRAALSLLMQRHFPALFRANSANMRWKKFFYRQICGDQDFALCLSPSCDECPERAACFAPDNG